MSAILLVFFISGMALMVGTTSAQAPGLELNSLCVMSEGQCWTDKSLGEARALQEGDYAISSRDLMKITNKLKQCGASSE